MRKKTILGSFVKNPGVKYKYEIKKLADSVEMGETYSALITFLPGSRELWVEQHHGGAALQLAGENFQWLMILPLRECWCITAFYAPRPRRAGRETFEQAGAAGSEQAGATGFEQSRTQARSACKASEHPGPINWYFDISKGNFIDKEGGLELSKQSSWATPNAEPDGLPCIDDIFLDLIIEPDGRHKTIDIDELDEALQNALISQADYDHAYRVRDQILASTWSDPERLTRLCSQLLEDYDMM